MKRLPISEQSQMGVRGLTTYIAKNADKYLNPHELHDCNLVIDGDSLASNLYRWSPNCSSAFGGNYDQYFRIVCNFFAMLKQCNVTAYVVLDGGYQRRKLRTVRSRLRSKVATIKYLNPNSCKPVFPILMREVFVEALEQCHVHVMRCVFEADDEVAVLARKLKCPVLSYDSDFYIHNVQYIPSITLTMKVYRKTVTTNGDGAATKRTVSKRKTVVQEMLDDGHGLKNKPVSSQADAKTQCYYYMDCCMYTIENLIQRKGLNDEMLPLFAVLLGNDYIKISIFNKFYRNVSLKGCGKKNSQQGKRIMAIFQWLQNQTVESAVTKVLSRVPKDRRPWLQNQIESAMSGYYNENCCSYAFFGFKEQTVRNNESLKALLDNVADRSSELDDSDSEATSSTETSSEIDDDDRAIDAYSDDEVEKEGNMPHVNSTGNAAEYEVDYERNLSDESDSEDRERSVFDAYTPPEWIQSTWLHAKLPRFVIDLLHLRLYVNAPQIENFLLPDAHEIATPILQLIFTILHHPHKPSMRYLSRVQRITKIHYKKLPCIEEDLPFDCANDDNFPTFKLAFKELSSFDDINHMLNNQLPADFRLFALSLIYWAKYSKYVDDVHISSTILSLIVLSMIDKLIEPLRIRERFKQKYGAQLGRANSKPIETIESTDQSESEIGTPNIRSQTVASLIPSITKIECIHAQDNLLVHFDVNSRMRKRHTEISSTILHAFAELQAIVYQLNCLNTLCSSPFSNVRISNFCNGTFLYNIYVALKERPDVSYYLENFIFRNSPTLWAIYLKLMEILRPFIACLASNHDIAQKKMKKKNRNARKNRLKNAKKSAAAVETDQDAVDDTNKSESDYEDLNNKFACLLNVNHN